MGGASLVWGVCLTLSVTEIEARERRIAVRKEGCKRTQSTMVKRSRKAPKAAAAQRGGKDKERYHRMKRLNITYAKLPTNCPCDILC